MITNQVWVFPEVRAAFVAAQRMLVQPETVNAAQAFSRQVSCAHFAQRYDTLRRLPRCARRALERSWKQPLAVIALLLTWGQGTALAATITVDADTPPIQADGRCALVEAILNANNDAATHPDCVAGNGVDTLVLPAGSRQVTSPVYGPNQDLGLPSIESPIVIEGQGSEFVGQAGVVAVLDIVESGTLTLNDTTVSGNGRSSYPYYHPNGGIYNRGTLTLNRSTISRCGFDGGLTNSGGTVTLNDSTVSDNERGHFDSTKGGGITNMGGTVTLVNSTVKNNIALFSGAGILNSPNSTLIVRNSTVRANSYGSGIVNEGTLTVNHSRVIDNSALWRGGGGINNRSGAVATIDHSTINANEANGNIFHSQGKGGGILNYGTMTISRSTISGNTSTEERSGCGGGIANFGSLTITSSTLSNNEATPEPRYYYPSYGGAICNGSGQLTITTSTISNNHARGYYRYPYASGSSGGAISGWSGTVTISNSTITGNSSHAGGGVSVPERSSAQITLSRTIVSGNTANVGAEIQNDDRSGGSVVADDYNLIGQNGNSGSVGFTPGATDIVPTQALSGILMPLAHNAGKTKTHALTIHSPALDASPANAGCSANDQRSARRPRGKGCDIGAFEGSAVMCGGVVTTHVGTPGNDVIYGTPGPDVIAGLGANDVIKGLESDDLICGGTGNDRLIGGPGTDTMLGEAGDDALHGYGDDDILNGGTDTDTCDGGGRGTAGNVAAQCESAINVP